MTKVICNKAKECRTKTHCSHKVEHEPINSCVLDECPGMPGFAECIPFAPEPKREVIEVTKCSNCLLFTETQGDYCTHYKRNVDYKSKPDYCKVTRIIVEMEEKK